MVHLTGICAQNSYAISSSLEGALKSFSAKYNILKIHLKFEMNLKKSVDVVLSEKTKLK